MPARDVYHEQVRRALLRDGWTITHDPLRLRYGMHDLYVDLGAEQLLAAEKGVRRIAVEIKSFHGLSPIDDLEKAVGQYTVYDAVLSQIEPGRMLYLAISETTYADLFEAPIGTLLIRHSNLHLMVFDEREEVIRQWTPVTPTDR